MKTDRKEELISTLKRIPIIKHACNKVGISRNTYYCWCDNDEEFAAAAKEAIRIGDEDVIDRAEIGLLKKVDEEKLSAIKYFLSRRSERYRKVRIAPQSTAGGGNRGSAQKPELSEEEIEKEMEQMKVFLNKWKDAPPAEDD